MNPVTVLVSALARGAQVRMTGIVHEPGTQPMTRDVFGVVDEVVLGVAGPGPDALVVLTDGTQVRAHSRSRAILLDGEHSCDF